MTFKLQVFLSFVVTISIMVGSIFGDKSPIIADICFLVFCVSFFSLAIISYIILAKETNKENSNSSKVNEDLEAKYRKYLEIVDSTLREYLKKNKSILQEYEDQICYTTNSAYLWYFDYMVEWISKNRITGKPDSFIIATCLMYSLIQNPIIMCSTSDADELLKNLVHKLNYEFAFECALEVISEPITYYQNEDGDWIEEVHEKVEIIVPQGIIKNSELHKRILNTVHTDCNTEHSTSVMQFSNLLHLIYLSNI